jgi:uncharacterized iron-regulated membrane protein
MRPRLNRSALFAWHSWLGLLTGVFIILIGFSGSVAVFKHEIDWLVTPSLRVNSGVPAPIDSVYASLRAGFPGGNIRSLSMPEGPRSAHEAYARDSAGRNFQAHVHPATAAITGMRPTGGYTWSLQNFIRQVHVRLLMGFWGRVFVGIFGVTLFLACLTGLYAYRNWMRALFRVRWSLGWRILVSDLHKSVGLAALIFNLLIAATGAVLGLENLYRKTVHDWMGIPREKSPGISQSDLRVRGDSAAMLPPSRLLEIAATRFPDMRPVSISFPSGPGKPAVVHGNHPGALIADGRSNMALDPYTGSILAAVDSRRESWTSRLYDAFDPLHFGYFARGYGELSEYAVKALWCLLGLTPGLLSISGFWLWYSRTRKHRSAGPRSRPERRIPPPRPKAARPALAPTLEESP